MAASLWSWTPPSSKTRISNEQFSLRCVDNVLLFILAGLILSTPGVNVVNGETQTKIVQSNILLAEVGVLTLFVILSSELALITVLEYVHPQSAIHPRFSRYSYSMIVTSLIFSSIIPLALRWKFASTDTTLTNWVYTGQCMAMFGLLDNLYHYSLSTVVTWHPALCWIVSLTYGLKAMGAICGPQSPNIFGMWFQLAIVFAYILSDDSINKGRKRQYF